MKTFFYSIAIMMISINSYASPDHHDHHHHEHKHETTSLEAHVHGELKCSIAVDQNEIYIELQSPAESLLGFEHKPKSDKEKEKWQTLSHSWKKDLLKSFKVTDLQCEIHEPLMILNVDEKGSHAQIHAQAQLKCPKKLNAKTLQVSLRENFNAVKKISIDVLPIAEAPYKKAVEGDQKTVELKL